MQILRILQNLGSKVRRLQRSAHLGCGVLLCLRRGLGLRFRLLLLTLGQVRGGLSGLDLNLHLLHHLLGLWLWLLLLLFLLLLK